MSITATTSSLGAADSAGHGARAATRLILAASLGNALEFYEILVYGYFAVVISKVFFPAADETVSILVTLGSFGVSFLARPVGAIFLGAYGDRKGRKQALTLSILLMTIGTGVMTLMPSYGSLGLLAPILVLVARLLQGFSVGGEFASATAFLVEHRPDRAGFFASWQWSSQGLAALIATSFGVLLTTTMSAADLQAWGWRIPFAFGLLIGPVGYYIRSNMEETPEFLGTAPLQAPLCELFIGQWDRLLLTIGAVAASTSSQYLLVYVPTYAIHELGLPQFAGFTAAVAAAALQMVVVPFVGMWVDKVGQTRIMIGAAALFFLTAYPVFALVAANSCARRPDHGGVLDQPAEILLQRCAPFAHGEDVPGNHPGHRHVAQLQHLGPDLRRVCSIHRAITDFAHREQARAQLLHDGHRASQSRCACRASPALSALMRFSDALHKICGTGDGREMVHHMQRGLVGFVGERSAAILQHDNAKIGIGRVSCRRLDHELGRHPRQHHRVDVAAVQHAFERRAEERVHAGLAHHRLIAGRLDLIDDFQKLGDIHAGGGHGRDSDLLDELVPWGKESGLIVNGNMDDENAGFPRGFLDRFDRRRHIALPEHAAASCGALLNIHAQHRGPGGIEVEVRHA